MKDRTTKFRMYATIDREEIFLNDMCQSGWKPVKIFMGMFFVFERCEPHEYIARVTSAIDPDHKEASKKRREQITEILTDSGAEIVRETNIDAATRIYAIRPTSLGEFEINTDIDSLIADCRARRRYHINLAVFSALIFVAAFFLGTDMMSDYAMSNQSGVTLVGAYVEFSCAALMLVLLVVVVIPISKYSRKIKELRAKREIEE